MTSEERKSLAKATAFTAAIVAFCEFAPQWALDVFQLLAWLFLSMALWAGIQGRDRYIKRRAQELVKAWCDGRHHELAALRPLQVVGWVLSLTVAAALARALFPGLAAMWTLIGLMVWEQNRTARAFVRQIDDDVKRAVAAYEEATNDPV